MYKHRPAISVASVVVLALVFVTATAQGEDATIRLHTGIEYSTGDFGGTTDIEDFYVPVTASINSGRFGFQLTIPYLSVRAPAGTVLVDPGNQPVAGAGVTTTESGLGDIVARMTVYDVIYMPDFGLAIDVSGSVKFGTADRDKGLGTGENDYSAYVDAYKFLDRLTLLGSAGYRWRGEPAGINFEDVFLGSIGGAFSTTSETLLGLVYDYRESALADSDDVQEVSVFAMHELNESWQLEVYAFTGFSNSSPDFGAGISVTTNLHRMRVREPR